MSLPVDRPLNYDQLMAESAKRLAGLDFIITPLENVDFSALQRVSLNLALIRKETPPQVEVIYGMPRTRQQEVLAEYGVKGVVRVIGVFGQFDEEPDIRFIPWVGKRGDRHANATTELVRLWGGQEVPHVPKAIASYAIRMHDTTDLVIYDYHSSRPLSDDHSAALNDSVQTLDGVDHYLTASYGRPKSAQKLPI